jgi:GNAT superfamily N-acetyltransferase
LIHAIEANLFALFRHFAQWDKAEGGDDAEMLWSLTDIPFPLFNSVLRARLAPDRVEATIEAAISRCKSRNVPMLWWTGPTTRPPDLGASLTAHGFTHGGEMPGMAADLWALAEESPAAPQLRIEPVGDVEALERWCEVAGNGFGLPPFAAQAMCGLMASIGLDAQAPLRNYLAFWDGEPVAASSIFFGAGVAGIYNVATLPAARRKGIGAAITAAPLREARQNGYRVAILHSSRMGENVYRKLGFEEHCKLAQYVWMNG